MAKSRIAEDRAKTAATSSWVKSGHFERIKIHLVEDLDSLPTPGSLTCTYTPAKDAKIESHPISSITLSYDGCYVLNIKIMINRSKPPRSNTNKFSARHMEMEMGMPPNTGIDIYTKLTESISELNKGISLPVYHMPVLNPDYPGTVIIIDKSSGTNTHYLNIEAIGGIQINIRECEELDATKVAEAICKILSQCGVPNMAEITKRLLLDLDPEYSNKQGRKALLLGVLRHKMPPTADRPCSILARGNHPLTVERHVLGRVLGRIFGLAFFPLPKNAKTEKNASHPESSQSTSSTETLKRKRS